MAYEIKNGILHDGLGCRQATAAELWAFTEIARLQAAKRAALAIADERSKENVALRADLAHVLEDRARFPNRPDDIGRMIEAHIGNLKHAKETAISVASNAMQRSCMEIERLRAALNDTQSLLVAMLLEKRPDSEIEAQITENRKILGAAS